MTDHASTDLAPTSLRLGHNPDGEVTIRHPDTGQEITLSDAALDDLAVYKRALKEWRSQASAVERIIDREIILRMDKRGRWTEHTTRGSLKSASPAPVTSYEDLEGLRSKLVALVADGVLDQEAVDDAVPIIPASVGVKPGALLKLARLPGVVGDSVRAHQVTSEKERRVSVS